MGLYKGLYSLSAGIASLCPGALAFTPGLRNESPGHRFSFDRHWMYHQTINLILGDKASFFRLGAEPAQSLSSEGNEELLETIRAMRVRELKTELEERKISTEDVFEKEELVKRLYSARLTALKSKATRSSSKTTSRRNTDGNVIRGDLSCIPFTCDLDRLLNPGWIRSENLEDQILPIMTIQVIDDKGGFPLKLVLDTGCAGVLILPSTIKKHNMEYISTPFVKTTGALGVTDSARAATVIKKFTFGYASENSSNSGKEIMGPLIAIAEDISVFETLNLDGIIGLWFLDKYACIELDLDNSEMALYKTEYRPPYDGNDLEIVAEGILSPTQPKQWTVDTIFDMGDGIEGKPVKMLLDTGATITQLSWKGLQNGLGLSRTSSEVQTEQESIGLGVGDKAMSVKHKIEIDRPVRLGRPPSFDKGLSIGQGNKTKILIGNLPILDGQLAADNVAGILGMNILSRASMIRMVFRGPTPRITLFQKKE